MENRAYIKLGFAALAVSLILNFNLVSRVDQLENQMDTMSNAQHRLTDNIQRQSDQIRNILDEFKEEQSWISRIEMNLDGEAVDRGQAVATFAWQVKELRPGSEVEFHYAVGPSDEFATLPVKEIEKGLFQVNVPLEVEMEPHWNVSRHTVSDQSHTTMEEMAKEETGQPVRFFVTVETDDIVRSGHLQTERLDHLGARKYGDIQTDIVLGDDYMNVNIAFFRPDHITQKIERIDLLTYEEDTLLSEEEITFDQHPGASDVPYQFFGSIQQERNDEVKYVIRARYSDGETFEREV